MTFLKNFAADESGASAAEYALILAVVGAGIAFAAIFLGTEINESVTGAATQISDANTDAGWSTTTTAAP